MQPKQLDINQDHRGSLYEAFKLNDGQVFVITIKPGKVRGNHYHTRKHEKFLVVWGSADITCRNRETDEILVHKGIAEYPVTVSVTPNWTHKITSDEGCMIICWVSEEFDENDPDTFAEEV